MDTIIDGIKFAAHKLGTISDEIANDVGERLLTLKGFLRVGPPPKASSSPAPVAEAAPTAARAPTLPAAVAQPTASPATTASPPAAK
ncbi:hypothetical protein NLY09_14175 (plasmid) [Burkholderia vietnamiensis]